VHWVGDEGVFTGRIATRFPHARAGLHLKPITSQSLTYRLCRVDHFDRS
jgi:hypothetical protein